MKISDGKLYRVVKCSPMDYLTVGEVYVARLDGRNAVALHRPTDGAGTYVSTWQLDAARAGRLLIVLQEVTL